MSTEQLFSYPPSNATFYISGSTRIHLAKNQNLVDAKKCGKLQH